MKSESSLTLHRQQHNCNVPRSSKDISKTVHVTSGVQLQFCKATRILFVLKENQNNLFNNSSPLSCHLPPFWRVPVINIISAVYVLGGRARMNVIGVISVVCAWGKACMCIVIFSIMAEDCNLGEKNCWRKSLFLFSLRTKKYFRCFAKVKLSHWWQMDCFIDVLTTFLDLGTFQLRCSLWRVRELSDFIRNILICVPKMNEGLTGLERHEGE